MQDKLAKVTSQPKKLPVSAAKNGSVAAKKSSDGSDDDTSSSEDSSDSDEENVSIENFSICTLVILLT